MKWRSKRGQRFWEASTRSSRVLFALAIFFTFAGLSILFDVPRAVHPPLWSLALYALTFGLTAAGYGFAALWDLRLVPPAVLLHMGSTVIVTSYFKRHPMATLAAAAQHQRLFIDAVACFLLVGLGYVSMIRFIHSMARGHALLKAEVTLARRIHESLVPVVSGCAGACEYYGCSEPSGDVGGDLVDVVERADDAILYVADVSGHGVGAGVLMAMLRSAAHAALADGATLADLLGHLNRTMCELKRPGTFATCAALQIRRSGGARYALAGHLPILWKRAGEGAISELAAGRLPLGLEPGETFESHAIEASAGDTFLIVTDGLTEVFQPDHREFGLEGIKAGAMNGERAPRALAESLIAGARSFGRQLDDQTVLAVRLLARPRA